MTDMREIETEIAELMKEVGFALYPVTREDFVRGMLGVSDNIAKMQHIDMEWRRNNPEQMWLDYLREIKLEKDMSSNLWRKMKNWD